MVIVGVDAATLSVAFNWAKVLCFYYDNLVRSVQRPVIKRGLPLLTSPKRHVALLHDKRDSLRHEKSRTRSQVCEYR